jgi:hypothetical protein
MLQSWIVALLVIGCTAYAAWTLMPAAARRALAQAMLRLPLPDALATRLRRAAQATSGCGCAGCDHAAVKPGDGQSEVMPGQQPMTFHLRGRR